MQDSSLPGPGSPLPANQNTVHAPCVFLGFLFFLVGVRLVCVVSGLPLAESMIGTLESDYHWMYLPDYSTTPHCVAHAVNHKSCLLFSSLLFNFNFPPFHLSWPSIVRCVSRSESYWSPSAISDLLPFVYSYSIFSSSLYWILDHSPKQSRRFSAYYYQAHD